MPKGKNTLTIASKYVLPQNWLNNKTFDGIFSIGNWKYFTMMQSSKEIIHKKHKRKNNIKSSWVAIMQMCPCDCGTDPVTPLLSFPMGVLSQEQMVKPASHASFSWKRFPFSQASLCPLSTLPWICIQLSLPKSREEDSLGGQSHEAC